MNRTLLGGLLVTVGAVVLILSALADPIGLGSGGTAFGWKQTVGVVVGAIVVALGGVVFLRSRRAGDVESPADTA